MVKTLEQAAIAVDEMFNSAYQAPGTFIDFFVWSLQFKFMYK